MYDMKKHLIKAEDIKRKIADVIALYGKEKVTQFLLFNALRNYKNGLNPMGDYCTLFWTLNSDEIRFSEPWRLKGLEFLKYENVLDFYDRLNDNDEIELTYDDWYYSTDLETICVNVCRIARYYTCDDVFEDMVESELDDSNRNTKKEIAKQIVAYMELLRDPDICKVVIEYWFNGRTEEEIMDMFGFNDIVNGIKPSKTPISNRYYVVCGWDGYDFIYCKDGKTHPIAYALANHMQVSFEHYADAKNHAIDMVKKCEDQTSARALVVQFIDGWCETNKLGHEEYNQYGFTTYCDVYYHTKDNGENDLIVDE